MRLLTRLLTKDRNKKIKIKVVCAPCFFLFSFALFAVRANERGRRLWGGVSNCPSLVLGGETAETGKETKKQNTLFFDNDFFLVNKRTFQGKGGKGKGHFCFRCRSFFSFFLKKESACLESFVFGAACLFCLCVFVLERTTRGEAREREESRGRASAHGLLVSLAFSSLFLPLFSIHPSIPPRAPFLSFLPAQEEREKDINKQERTRGEKKNSRG